VTRSSVYGTSPLKPKRTRRTRAELAQLDEALVAIVAEYQPMSVRGGFYRAEVAKLVPKEETGYDVVQRELVKLRRNDTVPYGVTPRNGKNRTPSPDAVAEPAS
jgi:hypothetical protein